MAAVAAVLAIVISGCASSTTTQSSGGGQPAPGSTTCTYTPSGSGAASLPPSKTDPGIAYTATMHTSQGDIGITLLNSKAPCTVNSFVHLAQTGFWAGTQCHRISTDAGLYMLQCGDPTAKANATLSCDSSVGSGGPGYTFSDENLSGATYNAGTVAMANAGADTNGSQFFLVFQNSQLSPAYTPFGTISAAGLAVLQKVAKGGTTCTFAGAGGGVPKDKVTINSVTITKG
jgi:peptidyl-prolyl cis-trans isomerase B (cyclophilin B)